MSEIESNKNQVTYAAAGVDIEEGARAVDAIRAHVKSTYRPEVVGDIGGFGGLFSIAKAKDMEDPLLVSGTDGVGTKLKIAQLIDKHDTVGIDLVAMCVNDILACGAEPLFFLDLKCGDDRLAVAFSTHVLASMGGTVLFDVDDIPEVRRRIMTPTGH